MTDEELLKAVCSGTTSKPHRLRVLYNDGSRFLVKYPGAYTGRRAFAMWEPGWVEMYDSRTLRPGSDWHGKSVWDNGDSGPMTRKKLLGLITKLGLDPSHARNS